MFFGLKNKLIESFINVGVLAHCLFVTLIHFEFYLKRRKKNERKKSIPYHCLPWQQVIIHSYEERLLGALLRYRPFSPLALCRRPVGPWWWQRDEGRVNGWQEIGQWGQEMGVHTPDRVCVSMGTKRQQKKGENWSRE